MTFCGIEMYRIPEYSCQIDNYGGAFIVKKLMILGCICGRFVEAFVVF